MSAVLLIALTAALIIAWGGAALWGVLGHLLACSTRVTREPLTALRAAFVLAPLLLGLLSLLLILVPSPLSHCHCLAHPAHHPHLCIHHPWLALPLLRPALPLLGLWLAFALWRAIGVVRDSVRAERWAARLRRLEPVVVDGVPVRIVESLSLGAFTVGLWRPVVAVDRALWDLLEPKQRRAVVHHENAHRERLDALTLAFLRLVSVALPWSVNPSWLRGWRAASEAVCDLHAARRLRDPICVAMALVSVERLRATVPAPHASLQSPAVAAGTQLEARVRALLEDDTGRSAPLANDLFAIGIVMSGVAALLVALPGSSVHHLAESLFGLLPH